MENNLSRSEISLPRYGLKCSFARSKRVFSHSMIVYRSLEVILSQSEEPLQRYVRKRSFAKFQSDFKAFAVLFWVNQSYQCQVTGEYVNSPISKPVLEYLLLYFLKFGGYFPSICSTFAKIPARMFICLFKTSFTAFAVLFLEVWRLIRVDRRYHCQDTGENIPSMALKQVLRHLLFYF